MLRMQLKALMQPEMQGWWWGAGNLPAAKTIVWRLQGVWSKVQEVYTVVVQLTGCVTMGSVSSPPPQRLTGHNGTSFCPQQQSP